MTTPALLATYNKNHIRVVANSLSNKYDGLAKQHVYWIAKELGIYPDAVQHKTKKCVDEAKMGKINKNNTNFVTNGKLNDNGIQTIESYLTKEGFSVRKDYKEGQVMESRASTNIWEQADLISMMKKDYEKAVAERDSAKAEAEQYCDLADKYEKEIEELKDKLIISQKENTDLKSEKQELSKMQLKTVDFNKEIDSLQVRIGKYNQEINLLPSDMSVLRKEYSALQTKMNQMQDSKKKLDGVLSDLVNCSKKLMNIE